MQEALRKDVERAFGVLQARFAIFAQPARAWSKEKLHRIMRTCIILYNMIVEDERGSEEDLQYEQIRVAVVPSRSSASDFSTFVNNYKELRDESAHHQLRNNLIKHLWELKGKNNS